MGFAGRGCPALGRQLGELGGESGWGWPPEESGDLQAGGEGLWEVQREGGRSGKGQGRDFGWKIQ